MFIHVYTFFWLRPIKADDCAFQQKKKLMIVPALGVLLSKAILFCFQSFARACPLFDQFILWSGFIYEVEFYVNDCSGLGLNGKNQE